MLSFVTTSVTIDAHGASYMGMGAIALQLARVASGIFAIASSAYDLLVRGPTVSAPEPLQLLDHLDARQVSAIGATLMSVIGCILGKQ